jgi:hypothetical protein
MFENTSDTLTTLCDNSNSIITIPLNNNNSINKTTTKSSSSSGNKNYFKNPKRRAETLNDQLLKIKGQENTNIIPPNEVF